MARFESSRGGRGGSSRGGSSRGRGSSERSGSFEEHRGRRDSGRGGPRRELEMTKVICSSCGEECEVPFKPTSDKPVYCSDCFEKEGHDKRRSGSDKPSNEDLNIIKEKLNKIMKALKIE